MGAPEIRLKLSPDYEPDVDLNPGEKLTKSRYSNYDMDLHRDEEKTKNRSLVLQPGLNSMAYEGPGPIFNQPRMIPVPPPVYTVAGQNINASVAVTGAVDQSRANAVGGNANNLAEELKYYGAILQNGATAKTRQLTQMQANSPNNSNNTGGSSPIDQLNQSIQTDQNIASLLMSKATESNTVLQQQMQEQSAAAKRQTTAIGNIYSLENVVIQGFAVR